MVRDNGRACGGSDVVDRPTNNGIRYSAGTLMAANSIQNLNGKIGMYFSRNDVLKNNPFDTCSVVFRNIKIPKSLFKNYNAGDWVLYLFLLEKNCHCDYMIIYQC